MKSEACAACNYQQRECTADCPLAPYFPPDQPQQFQNAHRLFGVSNILNILAQLDPSQKMKSEACAACNYQQRECTADCPLAPYFPPDQPQQFQNAHRLFGVSNILNILAQLDPSQKMEAMRSIVYQANIREKYPVHGCLGIMCKLQALIHQIQQQLDEVNAQLSIYRKQNSNR